MSYPFTSFIHDSHHTEAAADQHLGPKKGGVFFDMSYQKLRHDVKVPWINILLIKRKIGKIVLLCFSVVVILHYLA
jgi:hypothetical protein